MGVGGLLTEIETRPMLRDTRRRAERRAISAAMNWQSRCAVHARAGRHGIAGVAMQDEGGALGELMRAAGVIEVADDLRAQFARGLAADGQRRGLGPGRRRESSSVFRCGAAFMYPLRASADGRCARIVPAGGRTAAADRSSSRAACARVQAILLMLHLAAGRAAAGRGMAARWLAGGGWRGGAPYRIRTGVLALRGLCPGPLDEGSVPDDRPRTACCGQPVREARYYRRPRTFLKSLIPPENLHRIPTPTPPPPRFPPAGAPRIIPRAEHPISRRHISQNALRVLYQAARRRPPGLPGGRLPARPDAGCRTQGFRRRHQCAARRGQAPVPQLPADRPALPPGACVLRPRHHRGGDLPRRQRAAAGHR